MAFPKDKFPASVRTCSSRGYFHSLRFFIPTPPTARGSRERLTTFGVFCFFPRCMECQRGLAMRKMSVWLSVRLSVKRVHCDKTEERPVQIFIPYERSFSLVF